MFDDRRRNVRKSGEFADEAARADAIRSERAVRKRLVQTFLVSSVLVLLNARPTSPDGAGDTLGDRRKPIEALAAARDADLDARTDGARRDPFLFALGLTWVAVCLLCGAGMLASPACGAQCGPDF